MIELERARPAPPPATYRAVPHDLVAVYYLEIGPKRILRAFRSYLDAVQALVTELAPLVDYQPADPITLRDLHVVETRAWAKGTPRYLFRLVNLEERTPFPVNGRAEKGEIPREASD